MTIEPEAIQIIVALLKALELNYEFDEANNSFVTGFTSEAPILISVGEDYCVRLTTCLLHEIPLKDDFALTNFYKSLLQENYFTKMGKFTIDPENYFQFSIECRLAELNENVFLFKDMLKFITYVVMERVPILANNFTPLLFKNRTGSESNSP